MLKARAQQCAKRAEADVWIIAAGLPYGVGWGAYETTKISRTVRSAAVWPTTARAQGLTKRAVSFFGYGESDEIPYLAPFCQELKEMGYVEGVNIEIEYRFAEFQNDRLSELGADLARPGGNLTGLFYEVSITGKWLSIPKDRRPVWKNSAVCGNRQGNLPEVPKDNSVLQHRH